MGDRPAAERAEGRVRASETFKAVLDTYMAGQRNELKPHSYGLDSVKICVRGGLN